MLIYQERGVNNGGRTGSFTVSLTTTHFSVEGVGLRFVSIQRPVEALQSVVWIRDLFGYNIAVNFAETDGHTNYFKFNPRHFDQWVAAFQKVGITPIKNPYS